MAAKGDLVRELAEFERFAERQPNGKIWVKRWNETLQTYEFGTVNVVGGVVDPAVHVVGDDADPTGKIRFENVTALVTAGWIGD